LPSSTLLPESARQATWAVPRLSEPVGRTRGGTVLASTSTPPDVYPILYIYARQPAVHSTDRPRAPARRGLGRDGGGARARFGLAPLLFQRQHTCPRGFAIRSGGKPVAVARPEGRCSARTSRRMIGSRNTRVKIAIDWMQRRRQCIDGFTVEAVMDAQAKRLTFTAPVSHGRI